MCRILDGVAGLLHPTHTALAGQRGQHKRVAMLTSHDAVVAEGWQGVVAGRQGGVEGRVLWQAGWDRG